MNLPRDFLRYENFELAFTRIVRGGNKEYKAFYRHLFPSYNLALRENLKDLIEEVRRGTFEPERPTVVYQPKKSGILRPLTLLSLRDLIVYQAIVNRVAVSFEEEQAGYALKKTFGAIFAGRNSLFFYRSWKTSYRKYNDAITSAFESGNNFIADFDLVSFYELIEHGLLAERLRKRVRSNALLDLLLKCLRKWTSDKAGANVGHGVPQGPEPSAFLAECFLFHFDSKDYRTVKYFRYVDDIRLMAKDEALIRRALLKLDLQSKELGLVPQAQKIECRRVDDLEEVLKTIPSAIAGAAGEEAGGTIKSQADLVKLFRQSLKKTSKQWVVHDPTKFKFALHRMNPRRDVLRRITPLLNARPDLSWALSSYVKRFGQDDEAADILLSTLKRDPTYDASAANYIDAMDVCEPATANAKYRRVIETANRRSEEKSIILRIASSSFRARRRSPLDALRLIKSEPDGRVRSILLHRLFGAHPSAPFSSSGSRALLEVCTESADPDLARFSAALLLDDWPWSAPTPWNPSKKVNRSVALLLHALGLRKRAPKKMGVLDVFFYSRYKIGVVLPWKTALGKDWRETERRCLRFQQLLIGDPTARITLLDTFNELLLQNLSSRHPALKVAYAKAIGSKAKVPDLGNWLRNPVLTTQLPKAAKWFLDIHDARVKGELAHAKAKTSGKATRPISFQQADKLLKGAQGAWAEMIIGWKKIL